MDPQLHFWVHRAERADVLANALAEILAVPPEEAFAPEVVAVYSRGVERWLASQLATRLGVGPGRADGVCAGLHFPFPGHLVSDALARACGLDAATDPWRPERLAWPLLEVVDACRGEPWLAVLAAHLGGHDRQAAENARRFGAIRHLADLFDRYGVHRPSMILAWADGRDEDGEGRPLAPDVAWQAELWRHIRTLVGQPSPAERLADGCQQLILNPGLADLPPRLSLFGFTRLPASYLDVLVALAHHRDVHVFALHPSPTAWDHLAGVARDPLKVAAPAPIRHPLLAAWGRDSREMQLVLAQKLATHAMTDQHHPLEAPPPTNLLQRLQAAIHTDDPLDGAPAVLAADDRSVQIHACHGQARQAEVVRDAITHLLADDPTLEPRHIVVMCPDIDQMAPLLHAAFGAGERRPEQPTSSVPPALAYRLADRSVRQTNPVLGAVAALLGLVDTRMTASQVLGFAGLPPVRERFCFDDDDLARMARWTRDTGTRWGLNADHRARYDLAGVGAGTWEVGLVRLLLGVTMSEDEQRLVGGALPLDDVDAGDIDLAGRFGELIARMTRAVDLLAPSQPIDQWVAALHHSANLLLSTRPADAWQRGQLDHLLTEVATEAGYHATEQEDAGPELCLAEVRDLLADRLRGQPTRAAFRTGDLTMCTLVPMRSVPHRVVCVVGLDDGAFPRAGTPDGDDILVRARRMGDHDRRSEDRQLLLDAVLAATDTLIITYAGRDERTNEVVPPAVPVAELLAVLDRTAQCADGRPAQAHVVRHHPLQPSDRRYFVPAALGTTGPWSFDPRQLAGARAALGPRRPTPPFLAQALPPLDTDHILLDDLVRFFEHPAKAFLRQRLGLTVWTENHGPENDVAVELDHLAAWSVGDRLLAAVLAGGNIDTASAAEMARGLLPPGALGAGVLATAAARASAIAAAARAAVTGDPTSLEIDVEMADGRRLLGTVPGVIGSVTGSVVRTTTYSRLGPKHQISAWTRFLAAAAAHPENPLSAAIIGRAGGSAKTLRVAPLADTASGRYDRARSLLGILVDLYDEGLCQPIPLYCETSYAYAWACRNNREHPVEEAERAWRSEFNWTREDQDPSHVRVLDGVRSMTEVLAPAPRANEESPDWAMAETSRFARLARRLWDPVLDATTGSLT